VSDNHTSLDFHFAPMSDITVAEKDLCEPLAPVTKSIEELERLPVACLRHFGAMHDTFDFAARELCCRFMAQRWPH
jgi:hypothetical protein